MYESNLKMFLASKYEEKEVQRMWNQLMGLSKVLAIGGVLYATHTMPIFAFLMFATILYTLYKITWKLQ